LPLLGQDLVEGDGGHGGHGHALTVDRVERAAGVADDDEAFRPPAQPLEMPSLVVGVAVAEDRRHRLGSLDGLVEQGAAQATSEVVEAEQQIPLGGGEGPRSSTGGRPHTAAPGAQPPECRSGRRPAPIRCDCPAASGPAPPYPAPAVARRSGARSFAQPSARTSPSRRRPPYLPRIQSFRAIGITLTDEIRAGAISSCWGDDLRCEALTS